MIQAKAQSAGNGMSFPRTATPYWIIWVAPFGRALKRSSAVLRLLARTRHYLRGAPSGQSLHRSLNSSIPCWWATSLGELVEWGCRELADASSSPRLDTELLLGMVADRRQSHGGWRNDRRCFWISAAARHGGVPLAYLTGHKEFYSLELDVSRDTLVPRPETELLVDLALGQLAPASEARVLDLGTGCGAIALSLRRERPRIHITAVDVSPAALRVAQQNATRLALDVRFIESSWFDELGDDRYDLIVANPPYVGSSDPHLMTELRHEPRAALDGGEDGLDAIRLILAGARDHLRSRGHIMLEHGYDQGPAVAALARDNQFQDEQTHRDLAGQDRILVARAR